MAKVERNGPCPCGSGNKAKRCCFGSDHGSVARNGIRISSREIYMNPVMALVGATEDGIEGMFDDLLTLPALDTSLQVTFPNSLTPDIEDALNILDGLEVHRSDMFKQALTKLATKLDARPLRLQLARAVLSLRREGRISDPLAALAIFDLEREYSLFFEASVTTSIGAIVKPGRMPRGRPMSLC